MRDKKISLQDEDSAFIFRADGSEEIYIPNLPRDAIVPPSAMKCLQIMMLMKDPEIMALVSHRLEEEREKPQ